MFTLLVGPDKRQMRIHSVILANSSHVLSALVRGNMREARERRSDWSHVNEEAFIRFSQFLYGRDYKVPPPVVFDITPEEHDGVELDNGEPRTPPEDWTRQQESREQCWPRFAPLYIQSLQDYDWGKADFSNALATWAPTPNHSSEDWAPFFECQVQLYLLADMYLVEPLIQLVLLRTYIFLRSFELLESDIDTIIEFIHRVYESTAPRYGDRVDPLRDLVSRYAATVARELENHEAFRQLLEDHDSFAADLRTACQLEAPEGNWLS